MRAISYPTRSCSLVHCRFTLGCRSAAYHRYRNPVTTVSLFHTCEERDGMVQSGMEQGVNESYAALDRLLAK